ncbi:protein kinase [Cryptosporidium canis]|uniref:Protein kinase n=1 Tax=Cryptosporidium canis TaxID=195482 RepID=A0A9D5DJI2_9CRYT|nr:protein kinase [Cryptosporidium canis]
MPSLTSRLDRLNTPPVSFKNFNEHQRCIQGSQSSPYNSNIDSEAPTSMDLYFNYKQQCQALPNNKIINCQTKDVKSPTAVIPSSEHFNERIPRIERPKLSIIAQKSPIHSQRPTNKVFGTEKTLKNAQHCNCSTNIGHSEAKYPNNGTFPGCPSETFSQVISNNEVIEVKKDLIKRVPDASNGVLQRLKPSEYIKMDELILEPATQRGSFGVVFRGKIRSGIWANKEVAVKRWKFDNESRITEEHFKSLEREVYAYRLLRHPNICSYIGVCLEPGFYAIITEYLSNGNLFELLYENKVIVSASDRLKISIQLCDAVNFIHRNNMIHRDIKTANIILDNSNNVKLCDFGQTRTMNTGTKNNPPGVILDENGGSPRYMAPECFYIGRSIDEKSDIWAIGCCLLEIFGGPIPFFDCSSNDEVINAIVVEKKKPKIPTWFHPSISVLLSSCFERKPLNRPSSNEILSVLRGIKSDDIKRYGMNVKRNINGDIAPGNNANNTGSDVNGGKRIVGNCIGVAQQKRIVVRAPTSCP